MLCYCAIISFDRNPDKVTDKERKAAVFDYRFAISAAFNKRPLLFRKHTMYHEKSIANPAMCVYGAVLQGLAR